jgi:hypothetical protein
MSLYEMSKQEASDLFWEGMRELSGAAARDRDATLYQALLKVGRAALSQGIEPVHHSGLFVVCPVCGSAPGQRCINVPRHPLPDDFHPERTELGKKVVEGHAPPP